MTEIEEVFYENNDKYDNQDENNKNNINNYSFSE